MIVVLHENYHIHILKAMGRTKSLKNSGVEFGFDTGWLYSTIKIVLTVLKHYVNGGADFCPILGR